MAQESVFVQNGVTGHTERCRVDNDFYATDPKAVEYLLKLETFGKDILEPCCGQGHISEVLKNNGYNVVSRDLVDRGYGDVADFLSIDNTEWVGDIVTNPPFKYAQDFVEKSLQIIPDGSKVAMFLKLTFIEGKSRRELFRSAPPHTHLGIFKQTKVRNWWRFQSIQEFCNSVCVVCVAKRLPRRYNAEMV